MSARRLSMAVLAVALAMTSVAQGEGVCVPADTFDSCFAKLSLAANGAAAESTIARRKAEATDVLENATRLVAAMNTGDSTSTIEDYLPLLRLLLSSAPATGADGEDFGVEWSNPLHLPPSYQNKLSVKLHKSEIYAPLKEALTTASLGDQVSLLGDRIDHGDDATLSFSVAPASERYGRVPRLHQALLDRLLRAVDVRGNRAQAALMARVQFEVANNIAFPPGVHNFESVPSALQAPYLRLVEAQAQAELDDLLALADRLRDVGFYRVLDLINNQRQFSVKAEYRMRDEVVGPDEFTASVSYETGGKDVRALERYLARCPGADEIACLKTFFADGDTDTLLADSVRFRFDAKYSKIQRYHFALPNPTFELSARATEKLSVTAGLGRYIGPQLPDHRRARLDLALSYEDYSDDPARQDRGLATVTFTYPVAPGVFLSVGAVYATRPEFRGDVDREIGARAGFTYKLVDGG